MADLGSSLASLLQVPGLQELLNNSITQQRQMQPVRTGIAQQAANMLPRSAYGVNGAPGTTPNISAIAPANFSTPAPSSGMSTQMKLAILGAMLGGGGAIAKALGAPSGGGGNIGSLVNGLKNLFSGGGGGNNGYQGPQGPPDPYGSDAQAIASTSPQGPPDPYSSDAAAVSSMGGEGYIPSGDPTGDY